MSPQTPYRFPADQPDPPPSSTGYVDGSSSDLAVKGLASAMRTALALCDDEQIGNLPELIAAALEVVGRERGRGTYGLVEHRPGSWEATHITALAASLDWPT